MRSLRTVATHYEALASEPGQELAGNTRPSHLTVGGAPKTETFQRLALPDQPADPFSSNPLRPQPPHGSEHDIFFSLIVVR